MHNAKRQSCNESGSHERTIRHLSWGVLLIGMIGYFSLPRETWIFYVFAHLGALGLLGLAGSLAGYVAIRKGRSYWKAFFLNSLFPLVVGVVAVLIFFLRAGGQLYCGGSVSLLIAVLMIVFYLLVRPTTPTTIQHPG